MPARIFLSLAGLAIVGVILFAILDHENVPGAGALTLLIVLVAAVLLARWLGRSVGQATRFAQQLSRGGSPPRLPEDATGAAGDLFRALNRTAEAQRERLEELLEEKSDTELLLRELGEGVLALDPSGSVVRMNAELRAVIGASEAIEGRSLASIVRNPRLANFLQPATLPAEGAHGEFELFGRTMLVTARHLPAGGVVAVFADVTELRRLDAVRKEFVANASHELKTPLTAIRGFAETLADADVPPADRDNFVRRIVAHAERVTSLVDDMLTLARLEEPERELRRETVAVRSLVESIADNFSERAQAAEVEIAVEVSPPDLQAIADPEGLRQMMENLVDNALSHAAADRIVIRAGRDSDGVRLSVIDDGRGIPQAQLERVFERFYRVDPSRSRETGGTGLGLSIVRHWVGSMGGHVWVESALGQGSAFHVRLPGELGN